MKNDLWQVIDTGLSDACDNMRFDASLLDRADTYDRPILHLYGWDAPSATFGHFIDPSRYLDLERVGQKGLRLARRPTGGGIIFHIWDMAFSILVPAHCPEYSINTLDNYAFVNHAVLDAVLDFLKDERIHNSSNAVFLAKDAIPSLIQEDGTALDTSCSHFCMAKPTKYDVLWEGRKVVGAAQRKTKKGFLHQGSISLVSPSQDYLQEILLPGTSVAQAMEMIACPLLGNSAAALQIADAKGQFKALLATHLNKASLKYR